MVLQSQIARRRFGVAVGISVLLHALLFSLPARKHVLETLGGANAPFQVTIDTRPSIFESAPQASAAPEPPRATPPPPRPRVLTSRERSARPAPPMPPEEPQPPQPEPATPPAPKFDMAAMIAARQAERRDADAAAARGPSEPAPPSTTDAAMASINRNLQTLGPGEGVGGVFQILRMGPRTGQFAFNGFRNEGQKRWREVIEVDAGDRGDIERAMVRRMIGLIREHYTGDFNWNSHRQGRVIVLSARVEDNARLEAYLLQEFFGTATLKRNNQQD